MTRLLWSMPVCVVRFTVFAAPHKAAPPVLARFQFQTLSSLHTSYNMATNRDSFTAGIHKLADRCNNFLRKGSSRKDCIGFFVDGAQIGFVRPEAVSKLQQFPDVFDVVPPDGVVEGGLPVGIHLSRSLVAKSPAERTVAIAEAMETLRKQNELVTMRGWYNELYNIVKNFSSKPLFQIERAASHLFGLVTYGVHINGYTYDEEGQMMMWIGKRTKHKTTYPGLLDNMSLMCARLCSSFACYGTCSDQPHLKVYRIFNTVDKKTPTGGLTAGLGVRECAWKECKEEASVPDHILETLQQVGTISYCYEDERGVMPEVEFIFDLKLPRDFNPVNADGEMESFQLLPILKVKEMIAGDGWKPNCAFIILDFLIRHGFMSPDKDPDYCYFVEQLHIPLQTIYSVDYL